MAMFSALRLSSNILRVPSTLKLVGKIHPVSTTACNRFWNAPSNDQKSLVPRSFTNANVISKTLPPVGGIYSATVRSMASTAEKSGHDHGKLWAIEKYLSMALIPIVPLGVMYPNILFDVVMAVSLVMHIHWGVEATTLDYVRPIIFGNIIPKIAVGLIYVISVLTLLGLLNLTFRGSGIGNTIQAIWSL